MNGRHRKEPTKSGFEVDAICARHLYKFTTRAGVCKKAKKQLNKRFRKRGKQQLSKGET